MSVDPINPSEHVQAAMRLGNDRNNQAIDEVGLSRAATSAAAFRSSGGPSLYLLRSTEKLKSSSIAPMRPHDGEPGMCA